MKTFLNQNLSIMKSFKSIALFFVFVLATVAGVFAQTDIITATEFKNAIKNNKDLVIIDASKAKLYQQNHVKDAIHILYDDLNKDKSVAPLGTIQTPQFIADYMGKLGVSADDEIILYDEGSQKYSSRMYVTLKYAGAKNVKLVHKDMGEWGKERIMLTSAAPKKRPATTFAVNPQTDMMVDLAYVMANKDKENVVLVDTRSPEEFAGEKVVVDDKYGRIPGSINIPFEEFEKENGAFKSKSELQDLAAKYNLGGKEMIFFCKTGVKGAVAYIAFNNILGHPNSKLYEGGAADYVSKYDLVK
jgi:thiosulfate/3-mercaptopyruvate sulfurtransferase